MFELSSHRSSFNIENLKYNSGRLTTIHEFLKQRQKLLQRSKSYTGRNHSNRSSAVEQNDIKAFYQIATLIPDEVLYNSENRQIRSFEAAVLFADISGFTALSDKYQNVENGASKLSMVLNFYLGIMVQEILSHNGDIIKYAGDAFLATFRHDKSMSMQNSVQNAIDTAIIIQNNCRDYVSDIGVVLNVKIAISCGQVDFSLIGDEHSAHYVVVGDPVWQVKALQEVISPGEVLLTWKGWYYTQDSRYEHQANREQRYYKITGFKEQLNIIRQQYEATLNFQEKQKNLNKNMESNSASNVVVENSLDTFAVNYGNIQNELFSLRPITEQLVPNETKKSLRRFVIKPLLNAIDLNESIDSLIELRNIVIVFVNVVPTHNDSKNLITITDKIYKKLYSIVNAYEGTQNQVTLFDKDMMFLNIFGLRGFQHENDSEIALRCAHELHETFKGWSEVSKISIGVTTGKSYCGVLGHSLRREFSVVSVTTNKAARLMMAYQNVVSCDQETLIQSKMNLKHFNQLPKRALKGIRGLKPVYEFRDIVDFDKLSISSQDYDEMYGRDEVLRLVHAATTLTIHNFNNGSANDATSYQKPCFLIKSESQEGKSKVINKLFRDYHGADLRCVRLILNTKHSTMHFWIIKYLAMKIFGTEKYEDLVTQKLSKFKIDDYFFLLNGILGTKFKPTFEVSEMSMDDVKKVQQLLLTTLFRQTGHFWICLIDDADFIDPMSMNFLNSIMESQTIYFILTVGKQQKKWTLQQKQFYRDVTPYCLGPIDKTFHKDIACQSLNVSAIPIEFERFLQRNSNGNPGWIGTCAKTLLYSGKLKIKSLTIMEASMIGMILKSELTIHVTRKGDGEFFDILNTAIDAARIRTAHRSEEFIDVAVIESELTEKDYAVNYSNVSNKLMIYDSLSSQEQAVCKCASVLGAEFQRAMLNYLLPNSNLRVIGRTVTKLFQLNILYCASTKEKHDAAMWAIKNEVISCNCSNLEIIESCRDLPKYASCAHLTFHDERFRKYIYDTLTEKQLREYHKKCIIYLYRNNKNCSHCGGNESFELIDEIKMNYRDGFVSTGSNHDRIKRKILKELKVPTSNFEKFRCERRLKIYPLVLNYLSYDFRACNCERILCELVAQVVDHCQGKDAVLRKIYSQVTLAEVCLKSSNFPRAIGLLEVAADKLDTSGHAFKEKELFYAYLRGRVALLNGMCAEKIEQRENALRHYYDACDIFEISFPSRYNLKAKLQLFKLTHDIKSAKAFCKSLSLTRVQAMIKQQASIVLQKLCEFYAREHNAKMAQLAALWSLKEGLRCRNYTENIARCFRGVLYIASSSASSLRIDPIVFNVVFKTLCYRNLNKESLEEICSLYIALMEYQIGRNEVETAIEIGRYAKNISYQMTSKKFLVALTPILFYSYMKSRQTLECCKLVQEYGYATKRTNNVHASTWYYALCMDLILDTGNDSIIEYDACWEHHLEKLSFASYDSYSAAYARFLANFWLWNLRIENIDLGRLLTSRVLTYYRAEEEGLCNISTGMRIIDGLNLQLWNSIRSRNWTEFRNLIEVLDIFMSRMRRTVKSCSCFAEQFELCEIHCAAIKELRLDLSGRRLRYRLSRLHERSLKRKDYHTANHVGRLLLHYESRRK